MVRSVQREFYCSMICPVLFPFALVAVLSSFLNVSALSALVYACFVSLHILPQGLADELRLNRIIPWLYLIEQNICDEQLKAPPELGEGDGFSWGPRCLPVAGDLGR